MFVITVSFSIKLDSVVQFRSLMLDNARLSIKLEPGCKQFDVCFDLNDNQKCFLYEVYDNKLAFDAHLAMPHFKEFDQKSESMLDSKIVNTLTLAQGVALES
jgi:autoinducer 2-degrading protein